MYFSDIFIADPQWKEEKVSDGKMSITFNSNFEICSVQKAGGMALSVKDITKYVDYLCDCCLFNKTNTLQTDESSKGESKRSSSNCQTSIGRRCKNSS